MYPCVSIVKNPITISCIKNKQKKILKRTDRIEMKKKQTTTKNNFIRSNIYKICVRKAVISNLARRKTIVYLLIVCVISTEWSITRSFFIDKISEKMYMNDNPKLGWCNLNIHVYVKVKKNSWKDKNQTKKNR